MPRLGAGREEPKVAAGRPSTSHRAQRRAIMTSQHGRRVIMTSQHGRRVIMTSREAARETFFFFELQFLFFLTFHRY